VRGVGVRELASAWEAIAEEAVLSAAEECGKKTVDVARSDSAAEFDERGERRRWRKRGLAAATVADGTGLVGADGGGVWWAQTPWQGLTCASRAAWATGLPVP
jgi:hypothetical protein